MSISRNKKLIVELVISASNDKVAESIEKALKPDNIGLPRNMKLEMKRSRNIVEIKLESDVLSSKTILSVRNTIDDILQCIEALENTLKSA